MEPIIGIDLGTTNSEVAFNVNSRIEVICDGDNGIVPSCVGVDDSQGVIVGQTALNQAIVAPERTALSVKRLMGSNTRIDLGENNFTPQEISAFILVALKERAEMHLKQPVAKAVITVPAYFTDVQRQATREAGQIAGLEVVRIINEPTAAALAYEKGDGQTQRILVYDLGGGTFDVSIVKIESGVVEVLSSTGDNQLGGDDFDKKIVAHLLSSLKNKHGVDASGDPMAMARLHRAAEAAKKELSTAPFAQIEEDHIADKSGRSVHLSLELSRHRFEEMIDDDLTRTMQAVTRALKDAAIQPSGIDQIVLVGGSTRIPKINQLLEEKFKLLPHSEIDPDLCVAMGAGIQAAREMGLDNSTVLVDITPYTFGTSAVGMVDGRPSMTQFVPLIRRNTKLPASYSKVFGTMVDNQEAVDVRVCQGEAPNAADNVLLGNYMFYLSKAPAGSDITLHFDLDLNGILKIKAMEKHSGKHIDAVIESAIPQLSQEALAHNHDRINGLWKRDPAAAVQTSAPAADGELPLEFTDIIRRAEKLLESAGDEDREEITNLIEDIHDGLKADKMDQARRHRDVLDDLLFYLDA